ncbi:MAG: hypothetical protein GY715_19550 [Planctomycetes bacterium]|nr:hypothetical protein [Planctomycetota bacterium]
MNLTSFRAIPRGGWSLVIGLALLGAAPALGQVTADEHDLGVATNTALGLTASEVASLDVDATPGIHHQLVVQFRGQVLPLHLWPHSVRAEGYQVLRDLGGGNLVSAPPQPVRTVRGRVVGHDDCIVAGAIDDSGLSATLWFADGTRYWIEPMFGRVDGAAPGDHVIYDNDDVIPTEGTCGNLADVTSEAPAPKKPLESVGDGPADGGAVYCTQIAFDADWEYYLDYGSIISVENRINLITNTMGVQYEDEVNIGYTITNIVVRASSNDPYTSSSSSGLLCQFIQEWTNNQQGLDWDVAKLFTGREISGSTIGQAANIGDICDRFGQCTNDGAFCYSQNDCCGSIACSTDLMAHELGHLWDAFHCSCPGNTMNAGLTCSNSFTAGTQASITNHRNSRSCLQQTPNCTSPGNTGACCLGATCAADTTEADCDAVSGTFLGVDAECAPGVCAPPVGACCLGCECFPLEQTQCVGFGGLYAGDGVLCEAISCPVACEGACCFADGGCTDGSENDCVASGGTYEGNDTTCAAANCPQPPATGACCATDGGCSVQTSDDCGTTGGTYQGDDTDCGGANCPQPCPEDLSDNGAVDFADILAVIAAWGPCPPTCPEDLDGSGDVGFGDILTVIGAWGPCS